MKISIVTICYNDPDIEKTCESIVNQTFQNFEWLVIDGGSDKETLDVLNKYKDRINVFVSEKDKGVYNAMNKGIGLSNGDYLQFLNAGDCYYELNSLQKAFENLTGEDIIYGDLHYRQNENKFVKKSPDKIPYGWFRKECLPHPASFIKKELFDKYGLYNEDYEIVSDFEKWIEWIEVRKCSYKHINHIISSHNFNGRSSVESTLLSQEKNNVIEEYYGQKKHFKFFKIPILKILETKYVTTYYLFGFLPILKIKPIKMRLGVSYNLFDGEELLPFSIQSIRSAVDYINVVYQTTSNFGQKASSDLVDKLNHMLKNGLIDELYHYEPNLELGAQENEVEKRNIGLELAKKNKCTHFMSMDIDEFYDLNELEKVKKFIIKKKIQSSAVSILEYIKNPQYCLTNSYTYTYKNEERYNFQVPFIVNIKQNRRCEHGNYWFPVLVDSTRRINVKGSFYLFPTQDIVMHHMSTIRNNLEKKFTNSSFMNSPSDLQEYVHKIKNDILNFDFEKSKINDDYALFNNKLVKKVSNKFNIILNK